MRFGTGEVFNIYFKLRKSFWYIPTTALLYDSLKWWRASAFFIFFIFSLMFFFLLKVVLLRPIVDIFCGVVVIFCSIIIIYFTYCTDACFINSLPYPWTVCFFLQNNILQTVTGLLIFLVVNFICVSLREDGEWLYIIFGTGRFHQNLSVSSCLNKIISLWVIQFDFLN